MANSPQALKRARQALKRSIRNAPEKSEMRTYIKMVRNHVNLNELDQAKTALSKALAKIDRLAGKNIIHPNRAARLKSRLNKLVKNAGT